MFFEKIGILFFKKMRPMFFFVLLVTPILFSILFLFSKYQDLLQLEMRYNHALRNEKNSLMKKERKEKFQKKYKNVNPYFLNQKIESLKFLQKEKEQIENLCNHPAFPPHSSLKQRLLQIENNKPIFIEENIRSSRKTKESKEKLKFPIQMNEKDLREFLSIIEGIPSQTLTETSPQILITDLSLKKKTTSLQTDVWEVDMNLIKREFIQ